MTTDAPQGATWREWLALAVLMVPLLMAATDASVLFLALPSIAADLAPGSTQLLWILHVGEFLAVGFALTMGRFAERFGPRRVLVIGVAVYGVASLVAAYSPTPETLIGMRALLGIAAASLMPSIMSLTRAMFPIPQQFSIAVTVVMGGFSVGMALGPGLGGVLLDHFWWGAVFLINVPMAIVFLLGSRLLPGRTERGRGRVDLLSVVLSLAAIVSVVFGLQEIADIQASGSGDSLWPYISAVAVGLLLGALFVRRQLRIDEPLLDLRLFAIPAFSIPLIVITLIFLTNGGTDMLFAQFLQSVIGLPPGQAGLLLMLPAIASLVGAPLSPLLTARMRPAYGMIVGLVGTAIATGLLALFANSASPYVLIGLASAVAVAMAPVGIISTNLIVGSVSVPKAGSAQAVTDVGSGLGNALSLAFLGSMAAVIYRRALDSGAPENVSPDALNAAGESIGGAVATAEDLGGDSGAALLEAARSAFTLAVQSAFTIAAIALVVAAVIVLWKLRDTRLDGTQDDGTQNDGPGEDGAEPEGPTASPSHSHPVVEPEGAVLER